MEQKAIDDIKLAVYHDTLLSYPDPNKRFDIHTDTRNYKIEAVISQGVKPIASYRHKLIRLQMLYTLTEKGLLSIVETLKEFRMILLGQQLKNY